MVALNRSRGRIDKRYGGVTEGGNARRGPVSRSWGFNPCETGVSRCSKVQQPIAPAHDRGHDGAPLQGENAEGLRSARQELCRLPGSFAGHGQPEDVRRFQLHMDGAVGPPPTINAAIAALRFFFNVTLERPDLVRHLTSVHEPRKLPVVLNQEEVLRLLEAAPGLKYKAAFGVAYGAGLRVSEVVALKVSDIDSKRMTLRVEQGKGQRDRYVMLSPQLLELLREWWRSRGRRPGCFQGRTRSTRCRPVSSARAMRRRRKRPGSPSACRHIRLRHSFATHLLETERRHPRDPGPARNSFILPANTGPRARFTIGFTRAAGRWLRSSGD